MPSPHVGCTGRDLAALVALRLRRDLDGLTARLLDRFLRGLRELVRVNRDRGSQVAVLPAP